MGVLRSPEFSVSRSKQYSAVCKFCRNKSGMTSNFIYLFFYCLILYSPTWTWTSVLRSGPVLGLEHTHTHGLVAGILGLSPGLGLEHTHTHSALDLDSSPVYLDSAQDSDSKVLGVHCAPI